MNKKFFKNAVLALALAAGIFSPNVVDAKPITLEAQGSYRNVL